MRWDNAKRWCVDMKCTDNGLMCKNNVYIVCQKDVYVDNSCWY